METKSLTFDLKDDSVADDGTFEGLAAVFGNTDLQGDVIEKGAFRKTLRENKNGVPILWHHDRFTPIGKSVEMTETDTGLAVKGKLTLGVQKADELHLLLKERVITGLSIGYQAVKFEIEKATEDDPPIVRMLGGRRRLKELRLREFSPVTFGANPEALVTGVKDNDDRSDFRVAAEALNDLRRCDPTLVKQLLTALDQPGSEPTGEKEETEPDDETSTLLTELAKERRAFLDSLVGDPA